MTSVLWLATLLAIVVGVIVLAVTVREPSLEECVAPVGPSLTAECAEVYD